MNMFTHRRVRDCISLAVSGSLIPWFVAVCLGFFFTQVRLFSVSVQGLSCSNFSSLPPRHPVPFYCPPFHLCLSVSTLFFSPVIFPRRVVAVMHLAVSLSVQPDCGLCYCMHMQFNYWCSPLTASSALYGSLPVSNIPGDIVLCGAEYMNACLCACMWVHERDCIHRPYSCVNTSILKCLNYWLKYMYTCKHDWFPWSWIWCRVFHSSNLSFSFCHCWPFAFKSVWLPKQEGPASFNGLMVITPNYKHLFHLFQHLQVTHSWGKGFV